MLAAIGPIDQSSLDAYRVGVGPGMDCLLYKRGSNPFALEFCFDGAGRVIEAIDRTGQSARASGASARTRPRPTSASTARRLWL